MLKFMKKLQKKLKENKEEKEKWVPKKQVIDEVKSLRPCEQRALLHCVDKWLVALMSQRTLYEVIGKVEPRTDAPHDPEEMSVTILLEEIYYLLDAGYNETVAQLTEKGVFLYFPSGKVFRVVTEEINTDCREQTE